MEFCHAYFNGIYGLKAHPLSGGKKKKKSKEYCIQLLS